MQPIKLLIADDQNALIYRHMLEMHGGFIIDTTDDGEQAIRLALSGQYEITMVDIMLPKVDGLSAVRIIRRLRPHLPIVSISVAHVYREQALESGADMFVEMPCDYSRLATNLRRLAHEQPPQSAQMSPAELAIMTRRLQIIREQVAARGGKMHAPAELLIELEDLERDINRHHHKD